MTATRGHFSYATAFVPLALRKAPLTTESYDTKLS